MSQKNSEQHRKYSREYMKEWRKKHPERAAQIRKKYLKKHKEELRIYNCNREQKLRQLIIEKLGGICIKCGFSDYRDLQIDHKNGGGTKASRNRVNTRHYYKLLIKLPIDKLKEKYQLLCANCNWIKRYENDESTRIKTLTTDMRDMNNTGHRGRRVRE